MVVDELAGRLFGETAPGSEQIVLSAESVVRAPSGASLVEAATLPMNGLTAR